MNEKEVTYFTKKYLIQKGWQVQPVVNTGYIGKDGFIPEFLL